MSRLVALVALIAVLFWIALPAHAASTGASGAEALAAWEQDMEKARVSTLPWLAPKAFEVAERALGYARDQKKAGADDAQLGDAVTAGRSEQARAKSIADTAEITFEELLARRKGAQEEMELARDGKAPGLAALEKELADREKSLRELAAELEAGEPKHLKTRKTDLVAAFTALELKAVKKNLLEPVRLKIDQAKKQGAGKHAPQALAKADAAYGEAERFIAANAQARDKARAKGNEALFYARRLEHFTEFGRLLKERKAEDTALWLETKIGQLAEIAVARDERDRSFEEQLTSVRRGAQDLRDGRKSTEIASQDADSIRALGLTERKYEEIRQLFDPEEAEVLRDAGRLIVRLRAVTFPVGKADLLPENHRLLSRVKKAIERYGDSWLVLEGHTDSTGNPDANRKLSLDRAHAVRNYLVEQRAITEDRVRVHGYGAERPVASNKSEGGRALNRRIDVLFETGAAAFKLGENTTPEVREPASRD